MELGLLTKGLSFSPQRKRWLLILAALGVSGYGAYRVYNLPSLVNKEEAVHQGPGSPNFDGRDGLRFGRDDRHCLQRLEGVSEFRFRRNAQKFEANFENCEVGGVLFLVAEVYRGFDDRNLPRELGFGFLLQSAIRFLCPLRLRPYLEKTKDINFCDEMFGGLTNPKHQDKVRELLVSVCNGAVETVVKTSHQVLTSSSSKSSSNSGSWSVLMMIMMKVYVELGTSALSMKPLQREVYRMLLRIVDGLARFRLHWQWPSNRKFVLDVTGRVTFETGVCKLSDISVAKSSAIVTICLALHLYVLGGTRVLLTA
ncbi:hypothetical protein M0R45_011835 [Rubus argutus]|uniref:Uncharacterized protein n=1 Tax=Rubus argutus TaxID=59490 RepID=A0AAW1YEQ0_RUBAR